MNPVDSVSIKCQVTMVTGDATRFIKGDGDRTLFTKSIIAGSISTVYNDAVIKPDMPSDFVHYSQSLGYYRSR